MILWLTGPRGYSPALKAVLCSTMRSQGISPTSIIFNSLHYKCKLLAEHDDNKMPDQFAIKQALNNLRADCATLQPNVIVVNDQDTLRAITGQKYALGTVRGSLYYFDKIPCIVLDQYQSIRWYKYGKFVFELDLAKIARWAKGEQKREPAFDYVVCKSAVEVASFVRAAENSDLVTTDTETSNGFVTVVSYTYNTSSGAVKTFVVPFFDPWAENGAYWKTEAEEIAVHNILRKLNASAVYKGLANGTYDCAYFIKDGAPLVNYLFDSQTLMHSIWCEAPKSLDQVSSYFVDHYTYWKDENKGVKEDGFGRDREALLRYWRYNGLDSYYTWLSIAELTARITKLPWAMRNYSERIRLSVGPCLAASLRGLHIDRDRHAKIMAEQRMKSVEGIEDIKRLTSEPDFNVNSSADVAWFLYDILGAKKTRLQRKGTKYKPRSTDEKVLKLMKEQGNFFLTHSINRILRAKKPGAVISKYGNLDRHMMNKQGKPIGKLLYTNGRFLSKHGADATETSRFNSTNSQFWTGTNGQNIPPWLREMFTADPDYVFCDVDFGASDDRFIAYESEDPDKMALVESDKDPHCYHASVFFSMDYEKIRAAWKSDEPWCVESTTGVRQNTKRVTHGRNFDMHEATMYNTMGREAVVATARALGYKNPEGMNDKELIGVCRYLIDKYDHPRTGLYKRLRAWRSEIANLCHDRDGLATTSFGFTRKFSLDPVADDKTQRELAAFYGQGDTAGNSNQTLSRCWYEGIDDGKRCLFLLQGHDSFLFLIHKDWISHYVPKIKAIMETPVEIHVRKMHVPAAPEVGITWSKKMLEWTPETTYADVLAFEEKTFGKKFPKRTKPTTLEQFENANLSGAMPVYAELIEGEFDEAALDNELEEMLNPHDHGQQNGDDELVADGVN